MKFLLGLAAAAVLSTTAAFAAHTAPAPPGFNALAGAVVQSKADIDVVAKVNATVRAFDNGNSLAMFGYGSGFVPGLAYVSLIYDNGSTAFGPAACLPSTTPSLFTPPQMFVAYWLPLNGTSRTLTAFKQGASYVPLASIGTISVRYDSSPQTGNPAATVQTPLRYYLQSCGSL